MELSTHDLSVLFVLLVAVGGLVVLSPLTRIPYPIFLVVGGLLLGLVPGAPTVELPPDLVLIAFLPPLLYSSAFFTSLRDLRRFVRPISLLAVVLVALTTVGVAVAAHLAISGMPWAAAFTLGAVVAPTDALASTAIASRLGVPRRLVAIIEGESLVNDGSALVAYRFAVAAVVSGSFSAMDAGLRFVVSVVGGVGIGLGVGYLVRQARRLMNNTPAEITMSLLTGFLAYLPAEILNVSAVLAVVTAGVYMGWYAPELTTAETRLQTDAVWRILSFLLNAALFVLTGLQLPTVLDGLQENRTWDVLAGYAVLVAAAVIALRFVGVFAITYGPRFLSRRIRERDPYPPWSHPTFVSMAGLRGAVSLAAALALPQTVDGGGPFPDRDLIVFCTFMVILATLVLEGLSLPYLIRWTSLEDDGVLEREASKARIHAADAALARLDELVGEEWVREDTAERMRGQYTFRRTRFAARFDDGDDGSAESRSRNYQRLRRELLAAEQEAVVDLRRRGIIGDEAMNRVQHDIDLESTRLDV